MSGDVHVRFCERRGAKSPPATLLIARAIGWSQHGFCINCGIEAAMVEAVHAAYGAPVLDLLTTATTARR